MRWNAFVDASLIQALPKQKDEEKEELFPEHQFLAMCVRNGITYEFLERFTYVDIMKILISFIPKEEDHKATQKDIDKLLG